MRLHPHFDWNTPMHTKDFYYLIINDVVMKSKVITLFPNIDFSVSFQSLSYPFLDPLCKSFSWRIMHCIVSSNYTWYRRRFTFNRKCTFCSETDFTAPALSM